MESGSGELDEQCGGGNGINYFRDDALPGLIISGTKQLQEIGHKAIQEILESDIIIDKLMFYLVTLVNSTNPQMRLHNAEYFQIILTNANERTQDVRRNMRWKAFLEANSSIFDYFLIRSC